MESLSSLQRAERLIGLVRWLAVVFAMVQLALYEPPLRSLTDDAVRARPWGYALVGFLVLVGLAAEAAVHLVTRSDHLRRLGLGFLAADVAAALGFVVLFSFDPFSSLWTLLVIVPLEGAMRFALAGSLGVWAAIVPAYVTREIVAAQIYERPVVLGTVLYRAGLLLVVALFAGFLARDLAHQRRQLQQLIHSSQQIAGRTEPADILRTLCREACECLQATSAIVYVYDGDWFHPVASWPADMLATVLEEEQDEEVDPGLIGRLLEGPLWLEAGSRHAARLTVPVRWRGDPGANVLVLRPKRRLTTFETELAVSLADSAALALATNRVLTGEQRSNRRLRYLEALRTRFVATVAHDLRLPLTVFKGVAQVLRTRPDTLTAEQVTGMLENVERQANRLNRLAEDLLDGARLDNDRLLLHLERVPVEALVAATAADVGEEVHVDVEPGLKVRADPARLERVLWNLLANAEKYGRPPLEVRGWRDDGHVCITVRDHGRGVAADQRGRLFTDFAAGDDPGSVGLGLAIVRQLVMAHGGSVRYEDAHPGARFLVRLPLDGPPDEAAESGA